MFTKIASAIALLTIAFAAQAGALPTQNQTAASYGCIGAALESKQGIVVVNQVLRGDPAEAAGMQTGDILEAVQSGPDTDLTPVSGLSLEDVVDMIRGPIGTPVVVDVIRDGQEIQFLMIRQKISHD
jgi:carboxyl-terminal processing protease